MKKTKEQLRILAKQLFADIVGPFKGADPHWDIETMDKRLTKRLRIAFPKLGKKFVFKDLPRCSDAETAYRVSQVLAESDFSPTNEDSRMWKEKLGPTGYDNVTRGIHALFTKVGLSFDEEVFTY